MNVPRVVAVVIIAFMIVGLATFSFVGRVPAPTAPAVDNAIDSSASTSITIGTSTPVTPTSTTTGTKPNAPKIQQGPVSPEPKIAPKVPVTSGTPANPQPGTAEPIGTTSSSPLTPTGTSSIEGPTSSASTTSTPSSPAAQSFTVHANDAGADLGNINVPKGTPVSITFNVLSTGTYYGGLDFRSSVMNTGTITPGNSKTITFTAQTSFGFTPYWPASNVAKPYQIIVTVQ